VKSIRENLQRDFAFQLGITPRESSRARLALQRYRFPSAQGHRLNAKLRQDLFGPGTKECDGMLGSSEEGRSRQTFKKGESFMTRGFAF
jgi:hypothetical protein